MLAITGRCGEDPEKDSVRVGMSQMTGPEQKKSEVKVSRSPRHEGSLCVSVSIHYWFWAAAREGSAKHRLQVAAFSKIIETISCLHLLCVPKQVKRWFWRQREARPCAGHISVFHKMPLSSGGTSSRLQGWASNIWPSSLVHSPEEKKEEHPHLPLLNELHPSALPKKASVHKAVQPSSLVTSINQGGKCLSFFFILEPSIMLWEEKRWHKVSLPLSLWHFINIVLTIQLRWNIRALFRC